MKNRNTWISIFVILWTLLFHYESIRYFYLNPLFHRNLPQMKFLFPPAGWIMFFNVGESYGLAQVYGVKNHHVEEIDPHRIFETKAVLYDNIHRNVLSGILDSFQKPAFCKFLNRKFPQYDEFLIIGSYYPSVIKEPGRKLSRVQYTCP